MPGLLLLLLLLLLFPQEANYHTKSDFIL